MNSIKYTNMRYLILVALLESHVSAEEKLAAYEAGLLASKAAMCGEREIYLALQARYQLDNRFEKGKSAGTKSFPSREECQSLSDTDI